MAKETYTIGRRAGWSFLGEIKVEIECDPLAPTPIKLGLAVKAAVKSRADLSRADLSRAYLSRADLSGADLSGAYLSRADLSGAYLSRADLSGADLSRAYLSGADLSGADLSRAYLSGADLSRAYLSGADLSRAYLSDEALRPFKADLFLTLSELRAGALEAVHLVSKLRAGEVDGSTYDGDNECACLVGTLAQARGLHGEALDHNSSRPAERWFMMISPGDKPGAEVDGKETGGGYAARKALEWTLEWCAAHGVDPDAKPAAKRARKAPATAGMERGRG